MDDAWSHTFQSIVVRTSRFAAPRPYVTLQEFLTHVPNYVLIA